MGFSYLYFSLKQANYKEISSFEDCISAGFNVTSTYPERCVMPGKSFTNPNQKGIVLGVSSSASTPQKENNYKNLTYIFDGQSILFKDGMGILPSSPVLKKGMTTFTFTHLERETDINNDSILDTIFIAKSTELNQAKNTYYITAAISLNNGYSGLNALYVGTNIIPIQLLYENNEIVFVYKNERSIETTRYFKLTNTILEEIIH